MIYGLQSCNTCAEFIWTNIVHVCAKFTFSCGFSLQFLTLCLFCSNYAFLPHDYTILFQRVGRYELGSGISRQIYWFITQTFSYCQTANKHATLNMLDKFELFQ